MLAAVPAPAAVRVVSPGGTVAATVRVERRVPLLIVRHHGRVTLRAALGRLPKPPRGVRARASRVTARRLGGAYRTPAGKRREHVLDAALKRMLYPGGARLELAVTETGVAFRQRGFASATVRWRPPAGARGYLQRLVSSYEADYRPRRIAAARGEVAYPALLRDRAGTYALLTETGLPYGAPAEHLTARAGVLTTTRPSEVPAAPGGETGAPGGGAIAEPDGGGETAGLRGGVIAEPARGGETAGPRGGVIAEPDGGGETAGLRGGAITALGGGAAIARLGRAAMAGPGGDEIVGLGDWTAGPGGDEPAGSGGGAVRGDSRWRIAVVGSLADIVASDLPDAFAAPSKIADPAWILPGRVAWSWWSDSSSPQRYEAQREYVDFAARAGFEYVLLDAGWDERWAPELVDYARERDVRVLLWTDWHDLATATQREALLDRWTRWGIAGIKVDFLHSDSGERMAVMDDIAADAAARRLVVGFHGCTIPRGLQRTWPNVLTVEGVRGAEHAKAGRPDRPALNVTLAFTRNVIGSMDYTPVAFSAGGRRGSAAAQLAQAVVYESGLQHYADSPEAYADRPEALALLAEIPAAWDGVRLLRGAPRRSVTLARRSGERWFVGSISATRARTERVALRFLNPRRVYRARVYADDGRDGIALRERIVTAGDRLSIRVARRGGFTIVLTPA